MLPYSKSAALYTALPSTPKLDELIGRSYGCNFAGHRIATGEWYPDDAAALAYCRRVKAPTSAFPNSYIAALATIRANVDLGIVTQQEVAAAKRARSLHRKWAWGVEERPSLAAELIRLERNVCTTDRA